MASRRWCGGWGGLKILLTSAPPGVRSFLPANEDVHASRTADGEKGEETSASWRDAGGDLLRVHWHWRPQHLGRLAALLSVRVRVQISDLRSNRLVRSLKEPLPIGTGRERASLAISPGQQRVDLNDIQRKSFTADPSVW